MYSTYLSHCLCLQPLKAASVWLRSSKNCLRFTVTASAINNSRNVKFIVTIDTSADREARRVELIYGLGNGVSCSYCYCCHGSVLTRGYCVSIHELLRSWWNRVTRSLTRSLAIVLALLRTLIGSADHVHTL